MWCSFTQYHDIRSQVFASRGLMAFNEGFMASGRVSGATLQKTSTVRAPHVFNLLRQMEILQRSGCNGGEKHFEVSGSNCSIGALLRSGPRQLRSLARSPSAGLSRRP